MEWFYKEYQNVDLFYSTCRTQEQIEIHMYYLVLCFINKIN